MNLDLKKLTIPQAHDLLIKKEITVRDLVFAYLNNAKEQNNSINAFLEFFDDEKLDEQIANAQSMIDSGTAHMLTGIPYAVKDNILVQGRTASASSKMLKNYVAAYNATVIEKLNAVGAIPIGRTNMDEFAMGSSTENSAYGPTKNPIDKTKVPGGSSGGSAAALAMNGCLFALGTDTGGSIRQPAAFCGTVGLYPTYGSVSRYGAIAMGSSLDQIGPFAKNVADTKIVFDVMNGYDMHDAMSLTGTTREKFTRNNSKVIGVPRHLFELPGIDQSVRDNFDASIERFKNQGYEIRDIELPHAHLGLAVYYIIMPAEVSSNLSRFDGIRYGMRAKGENLLDTYQKTKAEGFGKETRRRIMLGTYVLSAGYYDAYYNKANKVREILKQDFQKVFDSGVDIILTPTTPTTAFGFGEKSDPLAMYMADIFTVTANLTHMPAISIPSGFDKNGMPFGIQMTATHGDENVLFTTGQDFEKSA